MSTQYKKRGIALLIAVLTLSVVLAVGLTILGFVVKQFNIATSGRESVYAAYAADAGAECALFWDIRGHEFYTTGAPPRGYPIFATSSSLGPIPGAGDNIRCADEANISVIWTISDQDATSATTEFQLDLFGGVRCAIVQVFKTNSGVNTEVLSRGYNVPCGSINTPASVERAFRISY